MHNPISTYRLQFHDKFRFEDAGKLLTYFDKLGVGTIYASPIFDAVPGSVHGYDGINPLKINPEIGTEKELTLLSEQLKAHNIGWLQDIVPNHMAYDTRNPWLTDVLEKGRQSPYSNFFDIRWTSGEPLMVPFLGSEFNIALEEGTIKLAFIKGRLFFNIYDQSYPLSPASYNKVFKSHTLQRPSEFLEFISSVPQPGSSESGTKAWDKFIENLGQLALKKHIGEYINSCIENINNSETLLPGIINEQVYMPCYWQVTHQKINYRRFFTVNGLICLNIQNKDVFDAYHQTILRLVKTGIFQGLRIDHIDGLYDPAEYLEVLRKEAGPDTYIIVEKILEQDEVIPDDWPVQGATGYSFLATINNLLTDKHSEKQFTDFYTKISRTKEPIDKQIKTRKEFILYERMAGELENLYQDLQHAVAELNQTITPQVKKSVGAFLIEFPVYRFYGRKMPLPENEALDVESIFNKISESDSELSEGINLLKKLLLLETGKGNDRFDQKMLHFYQRMMQISGPLMAKGVEDTLMYSYNRFIGHNEVGDSLDFFGIDTNRWHNKMLDRLHQHPLTMNTTSTHDTKRGEDVRARLNILTEIPEIWFEKVKTFQQLLSETERSNRPDINDEYFIYLTLLGFYPMPGQPDDDVGQRLTEYVPKALREAKTHSNWTNPAEKYEEKATDFALSLLDKTKPFWKEFADLHEKISDFGIINSITQLTLKCTSPGLPDIYQGTELWDLSLVDPDNRRPVDYSIRIKWLNELEQLSKQDPEKLREILWQERYNGKIKLWLTQQLLKYRKANPELFLSGDYIPLKTTGKYADHIMAFMRRYGSKWILVAVPLNMVKICNLEINELLNLDWDTTEIVLPAQVPGKWQNILYKNSILDAIQTVTPKDIGLMSPIAIYESIN